MRPLRSLVLYILAVLLVTALLAPWLNGLAVWGGHHIPFLAPLAERMRPRSVVEFIGQEHLLGEGRILRSMIENDRTA